MDRANRPSHRRPVVALLSMLLILTAVGFAPATRAAGTTDYVANCSVNLREQPSTSASILDVIDIGTVVSVAAVVPGDAWSASCSGNVSGTSWFQISAIGGATTTSLFGVDSVYAASGLFRAATLLEGIDVSKWQGTIDYGKVAAAGKRFVVAKATEGIGYTDPKWVENRANAAAAGLAVTGYHFARPDGNPTKPVEEAAWFASQLNLQPGMLVPALDLEVHGGLSKADLTAWVQAWLDEVYARTGARAMIYTSPSFWKTYLGDTRTFADQGYSVLWVAHWGVANPTVPGSNWGGKGWTFWQYTSDGTVDGITGRVDLDRFNGTDLTRVTFGADFALGSTPTSRSVKQGASTSFAITLNRTFFTLPIELAVSGLPPGASATIGPSPTRSSSATLNVTTSKSGTVTPTGTWPLTVSGTSNGQTRTTTATIVVTDGIAPSVASPVSRLYAISTLGSATTPSRTTWSGSDAGGIAAYTLQRQVDGGSWSTVGLGSATSTSLKQSLALGHLVRYRARATDTAGNTSGWSYGPAFTPKRTQQGAKKVSYSGSWTTASTSSASGGSLRYTKSRGASATFSFYGSAIAWVSPRGSSRGTADVYVDGVLKATVNLYRSTFQSKRIVFAFDWGANGSHTIKIVCRGTSGHPRVDVDAFVRFVRA